MLRTTYQRGADEGSSGLKAARRRTMHRKYSARRSRVHPVFSEAQYCMTGTQQAREDVGIGASIGVMSLVRGQLVEEVAPWSVGIVETKS